MTNSGAVKGFTKAVEVATLYGAPEKYLPRNETEYFSYQDGAALTFIPYSGRLSVPKGRRVARFPRMAVAANVPAVLSGYGLTYVSAQGGWGARGAPETSPPWPPSTLSSTTAAGSIKRPGIGEAAAGAALPGLLASLTATFNSAVARFAADQANASAAAARRASASAAFPVVTAAGAGPSTPPAPCS